MTKLHNQVLAFHYLFGLDANDKPTMPSDDLARLRVRLVLEEAFEFAEACTHKDSLPRLLKIKAAVLSFYSSDVRPDTASMAVYMPEAADALADLDYVSEGSRITFGIDGGPIADEVHASNMRKRDGFKDEHGKWRKPAGWTPPDVEGCLVAQGWVK